MTVALVHDYLTQRGGAERVVVSLTRAFPGAPLYTSLYDPDGTFPEFREVDVRPGRLDRIAVLRRSHRLALPFLARSFSGLTVDAGVTVCSSSGWAHGATAAGRKVVYCHTPARWLYQADRYLGEHRSVAARATLRLRSAALRRWDRTAATGADRYLANSTIVRDRIRDTYGIDAEIVPPPFTLDTAAERRPVPGLEEGFVLCVSRLLPYKNLGAVVESFSSLANARLVIVGSGPDEGRLRAQAGPNVTLLGAVDDAQLRWLYGACAAVVAASYEDFGLTPVEGAAFGKPSAVLRFGGFLDTVREGATGRFFDRPTPAAIGAALTEVLAGPWDPAELRAHAETFAEARFIERLRAIVDEELRRAL